MSIPFPSDAWIKALMEDLNNSAAYLEAAKNWEGDFYFVIGMNHGSEHVVLYMDLWHGKCRTAEQALNPDEKKPAFRLTGPVEVWKRVMTKRLDPMQAMMTGQLKLSGNMATVMRNVRAAKELVESCTRIPTDFPV